MQLQSLRRGLGKLITYFPILFLFHGCSTFVFFPEGKNVEGFYHCYSSDSLKLQMLLWSNLRAKSILLDEDKYVMRALKLRAKNTNLLFALNTDPNYKHLPYYSVVGATYQTLRSNWQAKYKERELDSTTYYFRLIKENKYEIVETLIPTKKGAIAVILYYPHSTKLTGPWYSSTDFFFSNLRVGGKFAPCPVDNPFKIANERFLNDPDGNYLAPVAALKFHQNNYQTQGEKQMLLQGLSTYFSLMDQIDSADHYWNKVINKTPSVATRIEKTNYTLADARLEILRKTELQQVVMFNEAHTKPRDRYFVGTLLEDLRKQGYSYLALESLSDKDDSVNILKFPTISSGFYIREPTAANLIRHAAQLGFKIISYDSEGSNREITQAKNLISKTISVSPDAKVVVLAGHGHIDENMDAARRRMMASYFKELSGIDPFTINLTDFQDVADHLEDRDTAFAWSETSRIARPSFSKIENDLFVINNIDVTKRDLTFSGSRVKRIDLQIPPKLIPLNEIAALLVYKKKELFVKNPLPILISILSASSHTVPINVGPGEYLVKIKDVHGEVLWMEDLRVQ